MGAIASSKPTQHQVVTHWPPRLAWLVPLRPENLLPTYILPTEPAAGLAPFKTAIIQTYTLTSLLGARLHVSHPKQILSSAAILTYTLTCARRTEDATRTRLRRQTPSRAFILVVPSHPSLRCTPSCAITRTCAATLPRARCPNSPRHPNQRPRTLPRPERHTVRAPVRANHRQSAPPSPAPVPTRLALWPRPARPPRSFAPPSRPLRLSRAHPHGF